MHLQSPYPIVDDVYCYLSLFCFSSPEPNAQGELIGLESSGRCSFIRLSTLSNINISEISWLIVIKFHQKHYWGVGLTL